MTFKQKLGRLKTVISLLLKNYPMPEKASDEKLDLLQLVALASSSDDPYNSAALQMVKRLEREYVDWNEVRVSSAYELGEIFKAYRLDPRHAANMKNVLQVIFERENRLTPDLTIDNSPDTIKAYLTGYGNFPQAVQDAILVLLDGHRDLPMSEAVLRFTARIGVADAGATAGAVQLLYKKAAGARSMRAIHYAVCRHCREICREKPLCRKCFLVNHCDYGIKQTSGKLAKAAAG
jgi:endonuclease III